MKGTPGLRRILAIAAGLVLCGITAWADPPSQVGRLSFISGFVSFRPGSLDEWAPAMLNYPLTAGDHLWTDADSRAEVHVRSAAIRLNSNSEFSFLSLDDEIIQVRLSEGSLNIGLRRLDDATTFEIDTPNATLSLLTAGNYRIDVQPNGETSITVRAGRAEVTAGGDAYDVAAGRSTVISGSDSFAYSVRTAGRTDEWDDWSATRDRREDQAASNGYISRDMIGAEDLDGNGTWRNVAGYGSTWAPSHVPVGWAPYRYGHWAWVNPWGWTWMDDAAWGFAPFHYGRWAYLNARWSWIPGAAAVRPVYAPALVVFVGGDGWRSAAGDGIGWFPLGPREAYIPPYQVSTDYVQRINIAHVTNINVQIINTYNINQVAYVNRGAPRGVTVVPRDVFVQSRPAGGAVFTISQTELTRAPLMGMTAKIAPQRESIIARPDAARAPVPQPPPATLTRRVYSRAAPPPAQVPFVQQQKALIASPGQPIDPQVLTRIRADQKPAPAQVTIVNATKLTRQVPTVLTAPVVAPVVAPAVAPAVVAKPIVRGQPPAAQPAVTPRGGPENASAAALISTLKTQTFPDADRRVAEAGKVAGIKLDLNAISQRLAAAKTALGGAEKDLAAGNGQQALQKATAIKNQVDDDMSQVSAAMQAAKQGPKKR